ncbi:hypothetical protein GGX14DRAFT_5039 [Mycena pura]|uniref:RanBD1 domain-containing protein n=1 Tax=Mycena pura TaxID=153505 RepID=A0AAD6YVS5_9AGAR|nr:hypothetical protein GGX14DRAFT_5039 [Mycena pura]
MLPVTNFVACGFAALSATVGYALGRKIRPLPSRRAPALSVIESSNSDSATVPPSTFSEKQNKTTEPNNDSEQSILFEPTSATTTVSETLKRKRTPEQEELDPVMEYPQNLDSIYPNKRRSGSVSDQELEPNQTEQNEVTAEPCSPSDNTDSKPPEPRNGEESGDTPNADSVPTVLTKPDGNDENSKSESVNDHLRLANDPPKDGRFVFPKTPAGPRIAPLPFTRCTASTGFAGFAGTSAAFFTLGAPRDGPSDVADKKPIWASTNTSLKGDSPAATTSSADPDVPALAAASSPPAATGHIHATGEEDESVALMLKGLTLFVKRGDAPFSGGIAGTLKLLAHKTTAAKRLLFRREPLRQVVMNVRLQPAGFMRCTFEPRESVLRVALKEFPAASPSESMPAATGEPQTVIYAFKPGRTCRRIDFHDFAEALVAEVREGSQS